MAGVSKDQDDGRDVNGCLWFTWRFYGWKCKCQLRKEEELRMRHHVSEHRGIHG